MRRSSVRVRPQAPENAGSDDRTGRVETLAANLPAEKSEPVSWQDLTMARGRTRSFGRGPLEAEELALAAVMASVTVAISLVGSLIPHAGPIAILGAVPLAIVSLRHRLRALLASAFAAATVGFIVAGFGPLAMVVVCATIGAVVGSLKRRGRGTPWVIAASLVVGPVFGAVTVGVLLVFSSARRLAFDQIQISTRGVSGILRR